MALERGRFGGLGVDMVGKFGPGEDDGDGDEIVRGYEGWVRHLYIQDCCECCGLIRDVWSASL